MISKDDLKYIKENKGDDVGFIFYSGDVLQDVAMMNDKMKGVYLSILALHMKNISFSYDELMMLSDSLSDVEKKSLVNKLSEIDGEYFINWVLVAIFKRRKYAQNRADNRIKGHEKKLKELENISTSYSDALTKFSKALPEFVEEFSNEFKNCDAIYGEDAGYPNEFVYAVKNKSIITKI